MSEWDELPTTEWRPNPDARAAGYDQRLRPVKPKSRASFSALQQRAIRNGGRASQMNEGGHRSDRLLRKFSWEDDQ